MSVMVLREEEYAQLFKFMCDEELKNLNRQETYEILGEKKADVLRNVFENRHFVTIIHLYTLNVLNYCLKYGEDLDVDYLNLRMPVESIDKKEALEIARSIRYNICDNFDTDDADYLIQYIEKTKWNWSFLIAFNYNKLKNISIILYTINMIDLTHT